MAESFKVTKVDRAMIAADPAAAFVGYLSAILAAFNLFERIGLTPDQVAILGGAFLGLIATGRAIYEKTRREKIVGLQDAHETLRKQPSTPETSRSGSNLDSNLM